MRLSYILKKFRKEKKPNQNTPSHYNGRRGKPFVVSKRKLSFKRVVATVIAISLVIIAIYKVTSFALPNQMEYLINSLANYKEKISQTFVVSKPTTQRPYNLQQSFVQSSDEMNKDKLVSNSDDEIIQRVFMTLELISTLNSKVSIEHNKQKEQVDREDYEKYRATLMEGVVLCEKEMETIKELNPSSEFMPFLNKSEEFILNTKYAYKYFLDHSYSEATSELMLANEYNSKASETSREIMPLLTKILIENNYKVERNESGQMQYFILEV